MWWYKEDTPKSSTKAKAVIDNPTCRREQEINCPHSHSLVLMFPVWSQVCGVWIINDWTDPRKYISEISVPDSVSQQFSSLSLDCDSGVYSSLTGWSNAGSGQHSRSSTVSSSSASLGLFESKSCDSLLLDAETDDGEDASSHQSQSCARNTQSPSSHGYLDQDCSSLR